MICKDKKQKEILLSFRTVYNKKVAFVKPKATPIFILRKPELHHSTHAAHSGSTHRHFWLIFLLFYDYTFSSQEHTSDRSCIFQSYTSNLSRIYHTGSVQVFVHIRTGIVTEVTLSFTYFLNNYSTEAVPRWRV